MINLLYQMCLFFCASDPLNWNILGVTIKKNQMVVLMLCILYQKSTVKHFIELS